VERYTVQLGTDKTGKYIGIDLVNSPVNMIVGGEKKSSAVTKFLYALNDLEDSEVKIHFISSQEDPILQEFSQGSAKVESYTYGNTEEIVEKIDELITLHKRRAEFFIEHNADSIGDFYYSERNFRELPLHFVLIRENERLNNHAKIEERLVTLASHESKTGIALLLVEDELRESEGFQQIEESLTTLIHVDKQGKAQVEGLDYTAEGVEL
jgi:hypothetical protein